MPSPTQIQAIIEQAVAGVLDAALPKLRAEFVDRAVAELQSLTAPGSSPTDHLRAAVSAIQEANTQAEILRQLLEGEAKFAGRVALFVVKGASISGWQGTGFQDNDMIKTISLSAGGGLVERVLQGREPVAGPPAGFDGSFVAAVAPPSHDSCVVLPLIVKDKVAALIYADGGADSEITLDVSALGVLTRFAAIWLELAAMRKAGAAATEETQETAAAAVAPVAAPVVAPPVAAPVALASPAAVEDELHRKARRFAKVLVEEIKLYNQPRVVEGKHNRDLYERLREDIEKSRATYDKRYRETPVAAADYFTQELIRILADNDISLMGASFPR
jgi:hypothetical protein